MNHNDEKIRGKCSYGYIINTLWTEWNFVVKLDSPLFGGFQNRNDVVCKFEVATALKLSLILMYE